MEVRMEPHLEVLFDFHRKVFQGRKPGSDLTFEQKTAIRTMKKAGVLTSRIQQAFDISTSTINYIARQTAGGTALQPKKRLGPTPKLTPENKALILTLVDQDPTRTYSQLAALVGHVVCKRTIQAFLYSQNRRKSMRYTPRLTKEG